MEKENERKMENNNTHVPSGVQKAHNREKILLKYL